MPSDKMNYYYYLASLLQVKQTCQILSNQAFLADANDSCKMLATPDNSCKIHERIWQDNVGKLEKKSAGLCLECNENFKIVSSILSQEYVQIAYKT